MSTMEDIKNKIYLNEYEVANAEEGDSPGTFYDSDSHWNISSFQKNFKIEIVKLNDLETEFDLINIDAAFVNAFRRILIAEIPTMAIEKVFVNDNNSILQDEVLAHRLGLIPLKADPRMFEYRTDESDLEGTAEDTLEFELKAACRRIADAPKYATSPSDLYKDGKVYSNSIKWIPRGQQEALHSADQVGPVHSDILLAVLRPGHQLDIKLHAVKGIGRDHAKFSPVATAYYRLLPEIQLTREVRGENAQLLQKCFSPGVIVLDDDNGEKVARVEDARYDNCSRNVYRHDELKDSVKMSKNKNHFIFSIESTGCLSPDLLMIESVRTLMRKCQMFINALDKTAEDDDMQLM